MIVIDIMEAAGLEAIPEMSYILKNRPKSFNNPEEAIKWSIESSTLKNL